MLSVAKACSATNSRITTATHYKVFPSPMHNSNQGKDSSLPQRTAATIKPIFLLNTKSSTFKEKTHGCYWTIQLSFSCFKDWLSTMTKNLPLHQNPAQINKTSKDNCFIYITKLLERSSHTVKSHKHFGWLRIRISKTCIFYDTNTNILA